MAQAATHPTAAVLGSPANSLGSALSQFLSHRTKNHPANQKLRQNLSASTTRPSGSFVTFQATASVILAVGSRAQRLQTASFILHSTFLQPLSQRWLKAVLPSHSSILSAGCNQRRKEGKPIFTITLHPIENRHLNHFGQDKAHRPYPRKAKPFGF